MPHPFPTKTHIYQNHTLDGERWAHIDERPGDIIIATPYKCGTTWMQNIVLHLIFQDLEHRAYNEYSPMVEFRPMAIDELVEMLEGQDHRRCLKSHLPLDGADYRSNSKYIVVGRDPRDVFMSMWNHYSHYTAQFYAWVNYTPDRVGPPLPRCPRDIREFWDMWISKGWFEWENEGFPHWSNFHHVQSWWEYRDLPNILFVHYNDLLSDLSGEIGRIAKYLDITISPEMLAGITDLVTFANMKHAADQLSPNAESSFVGGAATFINKGTNGRWKDVLTQSDLKQYNDTATRELSPDCRQWLENGRLA